MNLENINTLYYTFCLIYCLLSGSHNNYHMMPTSVLSELEITDDYVHDRRSLLTRSTWLSQEIFLPVSYLHKQMSCCFRYFFKCFLFSGNTLCIWCMKYLNYMQLWFLKMSKVYIPFSLISEA